MVRGIDYKEGTNTGYTGVEMNWQEGNERKHKVFNTGNFVKDWFAALKWFIEGDLGEHLVNSSSVDHFIMDGAPYESAYIHFVDEKPVLKYLDRSDPNWWHDPEGIAEGLEIFVPENTQPTWEELKEMCK